MKNKNMRLVVCLIIFVLIVCFIIYYSINRNYSINKNVEEKTSIDLSWLNDLILQEETSKVANPPASIEKCLWENKTVYVQSARCCDIGFTVYNEFGEKLMNGCGKYCSEEAENFKNEKENCEIVWKDNRSRS